jgi:hypothetical protein
MIYVLDLTECGFVCSLIVHMSKSSYLVCTRHCANGLASPAAISPSRINLLIMLITACVSLLLSAQALICAESGAPALFTHQAEANPQARSLARRHNP